MFDFLPDQLPWTSLFDAKERLFWGYLLSSGVIALLLSWQHSHRLPNKDNLKAYWWGKDARLDYRYFFVAWVIKVLIIAPLLVSAKVVALNTYLFLAQWIRPISQPISYHWIVLLYTVSVFVVSDFTRYWLHRWLHSNAFLWSFHKAHHSAEELNPLTFYRVHPVENLLFGLRYALSVGLVTGLFMSLFGALFNLYTILGVNIFIFVFSVLGTHLRHSPIPLSYGRWLEYVFISPRQHQIHHSDRHYHYNYGGYLAIWDTLFGSLKRTTDAPKTLNFGLGRRQLRKYDTVRKLLWRPFQEIGRKLARSTDKQTFYRTNIKASRQHKRETNNAK